jgi:hypothetical protein
MLLGLIAKPWQRADLAGTQCRFQLFQIGDAQFFIEFLYSFWTHSRQIEQFGERRRHILLCIAQSRGTAGLDDFRNLSREVFADAGELCQVLALRHKLAQIATQSPHRPRRISISPYPERICVANLQKIGNLFECRCDVFVVNRHYPAIRPSPWFSQV